jgi:hypothetical protein
MGLFTMRNQCQSVANRVKSRPRFESLALAERGASKRVRFDLALTHCPAIIRQE